MKNLVDKIPSSNTKLVQTPNSINSENHTQPNSDHLSIQILKRKPSIKEYSSPQPDEDIGNITRTIFPTLSYHKKWEIYMQKRNEIFSKSSISIDAIKRIKRSTSRMRKFFKLKRISKKLLVSAIITNASDRRFYAKVSFLDFEEYGLLDTGANISCIGSDLANHPFHKYPNFVKSKSFFRTADGKSQLVIGWLEVVVGFKDQIRELKLFVIPSISSRLILGIDFWKAFKLVPNIISSVDLFEQPDTSPVQSNLPTMFQDPAGTTESTQDSTLETEDSLYPLTMEQRFQLDVVIGMFPNFEKKIMG